VEIVCRAELAIGFQLAGLKPVEVSDTATGAARLLTLAGDSRVGIILVEDWLYGALSPDVQRTLGRRPLPMVVPFPSPTWVEPETAANEYVVELLRQAIGYRVRLA